MFNSILRSPITWGLAAVAAVVFVVYLAAPALSTDPNSWVVLRVGISDFCIDGTQYDFTSRPSNLKNGSVHASVKSCVPDKLAYQEATSKFLEQVAAFKADDLESFKGHVVEAANGSLVKVTKDGRDVSPKWIIVRVTYSYTKANESRSVAASPSSQVNVTSSSVLWQPVRLTVEETRKFCRFCESGDTFRQISNNAVLVVSDDFRDFIIQADFGLTNPDPNLRLQFQLLDEDGTWTSPLGQEYLTQFFKRGDSGVDNRHTIWHQKAVVFSLWTEPAPARTGDLQAKSH